MEHLEDIAKKEDERQRIKRLAWIVEDFLEVDLSREELTDGPEKIQKLKSLLEENLWGKNIYPFDPDWIFESGLSDIDNPDLYDPNEIHKADIEAGADTIFYFHGLLKDFWEGFKTKLRFYKEDTMPVRNASAISKETKTVLAQWGMEELAMMYMDDVHRERTDHQIIKMTREMKVHYSFEGDAVHFFQ